jgi:hypothetical protein
MVYNLYNPERSQSKFNSVKGSLTQVQVISKKNEHK